MICTVSALGWTLRKTWTKKHPWFCRQTVGLDHITRVHRRFRGGKKIDSKLTNNSRGRSKELWCVKPSSQVVSWNFLPYFYLNPPRLWNLSTKNRPGVWRVKLDTQPINKMFFKIYFIQIWKKKTQNLNFCRFRCSILTRRGGTFWICIVVMPRSFLNDKAHHLGCWVGREAWGRTKKKNLHGKLTNMSQQAL